MNYRNLKYLGDLLEFKEISDKFSATFEIIDSKILIRTQCLELFIYGLQNEDCLYFEVLNSQNKKASLRNIVSKELEENYILEVYNHNFRNYNLPVSKEYGAIEIEREMIIFLYFLINDLSDIFNCNSQKYNKYFS